MSSYETSYESLLQGVSQQVPRARLPGQLAAQENMLSDPVTGLRRRPGIKHTVSDSFPTAKVDSVVCWFTDVAGEQCHIMVESVTGTVVIRDNKYTEIKRFSNIDYLKAPLAAALRMSSVGDSVFIANVIKKPTQSSSGAGTNPAQQGFYYIKASAFSKEYKVTVSNATGSFTSTYSTPDGTSAGDAALSSTEYIAQKIADGINIGYATHGIGTVVQGAYVFLHMSTVNGVLSATSPSGSNYIVASKSSSVRMEEDLPASLPSLADGYIVTTGVDTAKVYYKFDSTRQAWVETGAWGSPTSLTNMPVEIYYDGNDWVLDQSGFEGRLSGDDTTNEIPYFADIGITGMASYQGRLVLLSGPWVSMSASNKPRRFFRSTVAELVDSDPIHIGSSANSSAAYEYAVPFNKDLLLFSARYQALIPSGSTAITPRTAQIVVTSTYSADTLSTPIGLGRTLMYPAPRSQDFFGLMEMLPSPYTDSQYVSHDSTEHLPKYLAGRCRFSVSSSVASMVMFGQSTDTKSVILHEFAWDGDEKALKAWHRWTFEYPIAYAYFSGELVNVVSINNGKLNLSTLDPRAGTVADDGVYRPFWDYYVKIPIVSNTGQLPSDIVSFYGAADTKTVRAAFAAGDLGGQEIGIQVDAVGNITVPSGIDDCDIVVGMCYESGFAPSQPTIRDENGYPLTTNKHTLLRYHLGVEATEAFNVEVRDTGNETDPSKYPINPIRWTSPELQLGRAPVSGDEMVILPLRTNAHKTHVYISTSAAGDLNALSIEYVGRYNQRVRRR